METVHTAPTHHMVVVSDQVVPQAVPQVAHQEAPLEALEALEATLLMVLLQIGAMDLPRVASRQDHQAPSRHQAQTKYPLAPLDNSLLESPLGELKLRSLDQLAHRQRQTKLTRNRLNLLVNQLPRVLL